MPSVGSPVPSTAGWSCAGCARWPCAWIATPKTPPGGRGLAARQMRNLGGMVSFVVSGGGAAARRVASRTRLFLLAESLGGVESLIDPPASMTHASLVGSPLAVDEGLLRLSVGIEHADDLIEDLRQALET